MHVVEVAPDDVRAGESWLDAARRLAPDGSDPVALDLAGEVKRWVVDDETRVALRPLTVGDLPDVVTWRREESVRRWWKELGDLEAVTEKYLPRIEGREPTDVSVWEVNGRSIGLSQDYRIADHPDYALLTPDPDAIGVDYLIGAPGWSGRGIGTRCLWAWLLDVRRRRPDATHCFAAPDHRNRASLRALAKVGFVEGVWFDETQDDGTVDTLVGCTLDLEQVVGPRVSP